MEGEALFASGLIQSKVATAASHTTLHHAGDRSEVAGTLLQRGDGQCAGIYYKKLKAMNPLTLMDKISLHAAFSQSPGNCVMHFQSTGTVPGE